MRLEKACYGWLYDYAPDVMECLDTAADVLIFELSHEPVDLAFEREKHHSSVLRSVIDSPPFRGISGDRQDHSDTRSLVLRRLLVLGLLLCNDVTAVDLA